MTGSDSIREMVQGYWAVSMRSFLISLARQDLSPEERARRIEAFVQDIGAKEESLRWLEKSARRHA